MSTRASQRKVIVHRTLPARPEKVFAAWLDPEGMREWMAPSGTAAVTLDGRVGGRFRIVMYSAGQAIAHTGEYLVIEPPSRLVFTWESPYTGRGRTVVTVLLEPQGTDTALTLTHEGLPGEHVDPHQDGWTSIVSRLEGRLARSESPPGASG